MADIPVRIILDAIDNASREMKGFVGNLEDIGQKSLIVGGAMTAVGGITALVTKSVVEQAGAWEQNQVAFTTMLGSAEKANSLLTEMREFAKATPFRLEEIVDAGKQLLAYGFAQKDVISTTEMLGNVASGLKIPMGDIVYLFGTLRAQGRAYTKDINQFTARGIPILDALAKQYGINKAEVFKYAEQGKISFGDIETAFKGMTNEGGMFFGLMDKQSKTTMGRFSNMQDAIQQASVTIGAALLPAVNSLFDVLGPVITKVGEWAEKNPDLIKGLVIAGLAIGAVGAPLFFLGTVIPPIIALFSLMGTGLMLLTGQATVAAAAGTIMSIAFAPLTLIIVGVAAAIGVLALAWNNNWGDIRGKTAAGVEAIKTGFNGVVSTLQKVGQVFTGLFAVITDFFTGGDVTATWFQYFGTSFMGAIVAIDSFRNSILDGIDAITSFLGSVPGRIIAFGEQVASFFQSLPEVIATALTAFGNSILDFFIVQLPYAVGQGVGSMIAFFTVDLPAAWASLVTFFTVSIPTFTTMFVLSLSQMLVDTGLAFMQWATVDVPNAVIGLIGWLSVTIPALGVQFVGWIRNMSVQSWQAIVGFANNTVQTLIGLYNATIQIGKNLWSGFTELINKTVNDSTTALYNLPGNVINAMSQVYDAAVGKAKQIYDGVKGWFDKIVGFFNDIIGKANDAINKSSQAFSLGVSSGQKRQFGGPVNAFTSYTVGEAGQETFVPQTAGKIVPNHELSRGGGGNNIQFIIQSPMIINSPNERRNIAEALYKDLVTLARSQGMSVQELFEGK